ncbi:hypothetical protein ACFE04_017515 [Oxalis oulophora]
MNTILFSLVFLLLIYNTTHSFSKFHQVFEITQPLPSDFLPPSCTHTILRHCFSTASDGTTPPPFTTTYSPPSNCNSPWSFVSLEFHAKSKGRGDFRLYHIAALWLSGVELLRTTAPEPNHSGIFWKIRKDVSKYSSVLLKKNANLTMVLENGGVNSNGRTGSTYNVKIKLLFYSNNAVSSPLAPHLIIPFGEEAKNGRGFWWFKVESQVDLKVNQFVIPRNTRKAVMELCASFHGNDEFWYTNPPNSYITLNNLTGVGGNGAFREVFVTIDGELAGSEVPFPVIFNDGFNPLFWQRVVGIGSFSLPCYEFDITPFLGKVLDGKAHEFGVGVNDATSYWLVGANLLLWLDFGSRKVSAGIQPSFINPSLNIKRRESFKLLEGKFDIKAKRKNKYSGWVQSSLGNVTTIVSQDFKFRNSVKFGNNGNLKMVKQIVTSTKQVKVKMGNGGETTISNVIVRKKYPLDLSVLTLRKNKKKSSSTLLVLTNVTHGLTERLTNGESTSVLVNSQDSRGWLDVKRRHIGEAITKQGFSYRNEQRCYARSVVVDDREMVIDDSSFICPSVYAS